MGKLVEKMHSCSQNMIMAVKSLFWKRDRRIVLFGAWFGEKFADNSRYLFQYLAEKKEEYHLSHVVWVTRNQQLCDQLKKMGYEAYMMDSEESVYYHKKAGMHIICNSSTSKGNIEADILPELSFGAKRVNLWHGVGVVKGVGCASLEYKRRKKEQPLLYAVKESLEKLKLYRRFILGKGGWGDFYFLSPTETTTKQFAEFSYIPRNKFITSGYPRTCECVRLTEQEQEVLDNIRKYKNTILYLPTFRTGDNKFDFTGIAENLQDILKQEDILWIQKSHSASQITITEGTKNNILNLNSDFDINVIMPHISMAVTDYSSAASDARFFYKPVLFFVPDLEEYMNGDNGVTEETEELLSGPQYTTIEELRDGIKMYISHPELAKPENYEEIRYKYWGPDKDLAQIWEDIVNATAY